MIWSILGTDYSHIGPYSVCSLEGADIVCACTPAAVAAAVASASCGGDACGDDASSEEGSPLRKGGRERVTDYMIRIPQRTSTSPFAFKDTVVSH